MKVISLDLRERILTAHDTRKVTRAEVHHRSRLSETMVDQLLRQRRGIGEIGPCHYRSERKPRQLSAHRERLRTPLAQKSDLTLAGTALAAGGKLGSIPRSLSSSTIRPPKRI